MDSAYQVAQKVELITPARFLFDSGLTPKEFNQRMLNDPHLKLKKYYQDGSEVFPGTDIKGGVVISYHDLTVEYPPIRRMYKDERHRPLVEKTTGKPDFTPLSSIVCSQGAYKYTELFFEENPIAGKVLSKGTKDKVLSAQLEDPDFAPAFSPVEFDGSIKMLARLGGKRVYRWIRADWIRENGSHALDSYKVFVAEGQGSGLFGETLSEFVIGEPGTGQTDTFLAFGSFETLREAESLSKYLRTKYVRALLGTLKVTQHASSAVWKHVPLQDFTPESDIDWSKSVAEIDQQLYAKYGLSAEEISFVETHVKEMV